MTATMIIREVRRSEFGSGLEESLILKPGVNVIVGKPNTGKTSWLRTIDYLMGDTDPPEKALSHAVAERFESAEMIIEIDGRRHTIARNWRERGGVSKVTVDGTRIAADDFSPWLLSALGMPALRFPRGNPMEERTWAHLSWRMLLRHIYRQERFWSDLADKQPVREQLACLHMFSGLAEYFYPDGYGDLVEKQKALADKEAARRQFVEMLHRLARKLIPDEQLQVGITDLSISEAEAVTQARMDQLQIERQQILAELEVQVKERVEKRDELANVSAEWVRLNDARERHAITAQSVRRRVDELQRYRDAVRKEIERLARARAASTTLADLRVTHCPACDQEVDRTHKHVPGHQCELCHRELPDGSTGKEAALHRMEFELSQLKAEDAELSEVIQRLTAELETVVREHAATEARLSAVEYSLRQARHAASSLLPARLQALDGEYGEFRAHLSQLARLREALRLRDEMDGEIEGLMKEVRTLRAELEALTADVEVFQPSADLTDGMTTYLNSINVAEPGTWPLPPVAVDIRERTFRMLIGDKDWSTRAGATMSCYFLCAYHYSLLRNTFSRQWRYPGLAIIDFPASLATGEVLGDRENYLIAPFCKIPLGAERPWQVIVAGRAFRDLRPAHHIALSRVWT